MIARILPREEWPVLADLHPPVLAELVPEGKSAVVVVEDGGEVIGTLSVLQITHLEGLWISPRHRGNPVLAMALVEAAFEEVRKTGADWAWGGSDTDHVSDIIRRVGGKELEIKSYAIPVGGSQHA